MPKNELIKVELQWAVCQRFESYSRKSPRPSDKQKKVWESVHPEFDNTSYPLQLAGPLPLPLPHLPTANGPNIVHRLFVARVNARSNEAYFQHSYCVPQCGTRGHFAGTLSSSQPTTTNHLWGRTREKILLPNGLFSLLRWIRKTGKIAATQPAKAVVS